MKRFFLYLKALITAPRSLVHDNILLLNPFKEEVKNANYNRKAVVVFLDKLEKYSLFILLSNFIFCIFCCEQAGADRSFTVENYHNLTFLDNPNFHFYFVIFIYLAKTFMFFRITFLLVFSVIFKCFGLSMKEAIENKEKHFRLQCFIMVVLYIIALCILFLIPGVPEFVLTRNINLH